jgi:hypothetical protein
MLDEPSRTNLEKAVPESEQLWTAEQAAEFFDVPTSEMGRFMEGGALESHPAYPEGRVFSKEWLLNFLAAKSDEYSTLAKELSSTDLELIHGYQNWQDKILSDLSVG